jgi:DNA-binding NarL/FixJ family response regulator
MPGERAAGEDTSPIRLVIVDDAERTRELLRRLAELDGRFEVVGEAADGVEALRRVRAEEPDVVLLDVRMPQMDGIDALEEIKQDALETRVVMYSADSTRRREALDAGADAWVDKTESFRLLADVLAGADRQDTPERVIDLTHEETRVD